MNTKRDLTEVKGYIYKCTAPNGKIYIGQTLNKKTRRFAYKYNNFKGQTKLWNSCQAHNWNPIDTFEIIEECLCGNEKQFMNEREIYWIAFYDSLKNGLNCNEGGNGQTGHTWTEEQKQAMSEKKKGIPSKFKGIPNGRKQSKETLEKRFTSETKKKMSDAAMGKSNAKGKRTQEQCERIKLGKIKSFKENGTKRIYLPVSEEVKEILREKSKGNSNARGKRTPEQIERIKEGTRLARLLNIAYYYNIN